MGLWQVEVWLADSMMKGGKGIGVKGLSPWVGKVGRLLMDALPNEGLAKLAGWKKSSVHEREEGIAPAILVGMIWSLGWEKAPHRLSRWAGS